MSIRSLIFDQLWLKLFSLVLATLIWLAVWANLGGERISKFTRSFINQPILVLTTESADRPSFNVIPERATVTVRGPVDLIQSMKDTDISVFVRVVDPRQTAGDLPVQVYLPAGASVALVTPLTAQVRSGFAKPAAQAAQP